MAPTRTSQVAKQGACYGCGSPLQIEIPDGAGFVKRDKYETKLRHKQLNQVRRACRSVSHALCGGFESSQTTAAAAPAEA